MWSIRTGYDLLLPGRSSGPISAGLTVKQLTVQELCTLLPCYNVASMVQALVDRPDEVRRPINFKRLALTDYKLDIPRQAKKTVLSKALDESGTT